MNIAVDRPSTLIRINISRSPAKTVEKKKQGSCDTIDFYSFSHDMDDSSMFNDICDKRHSGQKLYNSEPWLNKNSTTDVRKHVGIFDDSKNASVHRIKGMEHSSLDTEFIISSLKFDLRVRSYEVCTSYLLIFFTSITDAVSFYKQYYGIVELVFQPRCDWMLGETGVPFDRSISTLYEKTVLLPEVTVTTSQAIFTTTETVYGRERFQQRVDYFNQLRSEISKTEIQRYMADLSNFKTDFVYTDTKDLAVGCKSNKIMQDAIKMMSGSEIDKVYACLEYDIVPIAATKHGAYTVQTLLNYSTNLSHKKLISKYFKLEGEFLLSHDIGNYTFQKLLSFDTKLVCDCFISNFTDIGSTDLGFKVFKRCSVNMREYKHVFLDELHKCAQGEVQKAAQLKSIIDHL